MTDDELERWLERLDRQLERHASSHEELRARAVEHTRARDAELAAIREEIRVHRAEVRAEARAAGRTWGLVGAALGALGALVGAVGAVARMAS